MIIILLNSYNTHQKRIDMNISGTKIKPFVYFALSWMIPGFGHFLLKKKQKAVVFFFGILGLILIGLWMGGEIGALHGFQPIHVMEFIGSLGNGLFYFFFKLTGLGNGQLNSVSYHYGTAYIGVAGFLNFLIAMKVFSIVKEKMHV